MKHITTIIIAAALAGCATEHVTPGTRHITWQAVPDPHPVCAHRVGRPAPAGQRYAGCVVPGPQACQIVTGTHVSSDLVWRELAACADRH